MCYLDVSVPTMADPLHPADRVDLTSNFLKACITYGVDYPIIISVLNAGRLPYPPPTGLCTCVLLQRKTAPNSSGT